jgi:hypothetical protein
MPAGGSRLVIWVVINVTIDIILELMSFSTELICRVVEIGKPKNLFCLCYSYLNQVRLNSG